MAIEALNFLHYYTDDLREIYDLIVKSSKTNFDGIWERVMREYALNSIPYFPSNIAIKDLTQDVHIAKTTGIDLSITRAVKLSLEKLAKIKTGEL